MMRIKRNIRGFTMAELLIVVAIIAVLSSVSFIAVQQYSRSMAQLERDTIAKEIFVAAQNHLTQANSQGYPGVTEFGTLEDEPQNIYYYVINGSADFTEEGTSAIDLMLPFASIDETVRARGSYIIRYQSNPAVVLDVFYCPPTGQYAHVFESGEYETLKSMRVDKKNARRNYNGAVIGWYGGGQPLETGEVINAPDIRVENGDKLIVKVYNTNVDSMGTPGKNTEEVSLKLVIKGVTSQAMMAIPLYNVPETNRYSTTEESETKVLEYAVVLDDITTTASDADIANMRFADMRFAALNGESYSTYRNDRTFIPGENIVVSAVAYSNKKLTNVAYSREYTTNSLFADMQPQPDGVAADQVYISSIRHLENLDKAVSGLVNSTKDPLKFEEGKVQNRYDIQKAVQTKDLSFPEFKNAVSDTPDAVKVLKVLYNVSSDGGLTKTISTAEGCYKPVDLDYTLTYEGQIESTTESTTPLDEDDEDALPERHTVTGIKVDGYSGDAGVFGAVSVTGWINNLEIVDCDIVSTGAGNSAGALAGSLNKVNVKNVVAYETGETDETETVIRNITAEGNAGGLIGSLTAVTSEGVTLGKVENCAAALYVSGKDAGGLIGSINGAAQVIASYSGGHTDKGEYYRHDAETGKRTDPIINVDGTDHAGGLIGLAGGATIRTSYSTCSVRGKTAGGLAGSAEGHIDHSYCTGLVETTDAEGAVKGAFAGVWTTDDVSKATGCKFYEIINGDLPALGTGSTAGITVDALDEDAGSYNAFVGAPTTWNAAVPYDTALGNYFKVEGVDPKTRFNLRTVDQLDLEKAATDAVHYGDWPAPETIVTNEKAE